MIVKKESTSAFGYTEVGVGRASSLIVIIKTKGGLLLPAGPRGPLRHFIRAVAPEGLP